jgi:stringent starvation protein B
MVHPVQSVVESLYAAGRCPRLHVNATCDGVVCPDFIREQWQERLIIDLDSSYPLDLTYSEEGIGADLSFGGYVTRCKFPWKAIYVVADRATGRGIVLDQNMPESVKRSRSAPTTGPLPTDGDLTEVFEAKDTRVGVPGRRNRRKSPTGKLHAQPDLDGATPAGLHAAPPAGLHAAPSASSAPTPSLHAAGPVAHAGTGTQPPSATPPTALTGASPGGSQPAAEPDRDNEVQRRRAAFKVIDGGS